MADDETETGTDTGTETETETDTGTHDETVCTAKIAELTAQLADNATTIAAMDAELSKSKAANYDLLMSVPQDAESESASEEMSTDDTTPDIDDLFTE